MIYASNDSAQLLYKCFSFPSNLWKSSKAKYTFKPIWKKRDCNCISTGHEKFGWLKRFCGDTTQCQCCSVDAMLLTLLKWAFSVLALIHCSANSMPLFRSCNIQPPPHHAEHLGILLSHLIYLPSICLSSICLWWIGTWTNLLSI